MKGYAKVLRDDGTIQQIKDIVALTELYAKEWKKSVKVVTTGTLWKTTDVTYSDVRSNFTPYVEIKDWSDITSSFSNIKYEDSVWLQYTPKMQAMKMIVTLFEGVDEVHMDDELKRVWNEFRENN